ncbi:MAG: hypothetical protein RLZZ234_84, partial [Candidatus Parcubacteria bacterium]
RSEPTLLRIFNPVPQAATGSTTAAKEAEVITTTITSTTLDLAKREPVQNVATEIKTFIAPRPAPEVAPTEELRTSTSSQQQVAASTTPVRENPVDPQIDVKALRFIESFDTDFKELLDLYGVALRADDKAGIQRIQERIMELRRQSLDRVETEIVKEDTPAEFAQQVRDRISTLMQTAQERREKEERLIQDRVGEKIKRDSDRDGVADYDEVHQYYTDPFVADSDADGFSDGAEILSGYDPKSEVREAAVAFEDPRKAGALREDILKIERLDVLAFSQPATSTEPQEEKVIFSGMALPNSFVTLYIFSTPIVVTVKTHDDGSWNYAFDKELEEGQHEIFVGMTDNAGKLIAKSTAFPFIKTANAYSIGRVSDQPMAVPAPAQSLFSENALVLTMSLVVMLVGLVLVLIGAHLAKHAKPHSVVAPVAAPV